MPESTSAVIDAGDPNAVANLNRIPGYDQRGAPFDRVLDGIDNGDFNPRIDIGSVEYGNYAPTVVDIVFSSSLNIHDPYSFADAEDPHDGPVTGSGDQLRTVPVGGMDTIEVVFSQDVHITVDDIEILGLRTANKPVPVQESFEYESTTRTVKCRFEGWELLGDQYVLSVADTVTDMDDVPLDGDWTNPRELSTVNLAISEFSSGDGQPGGSLDFIFTVMPGDANLDLKVDGLDLDILAAHFNMITDQYINADFNGDGSINGLDLDDIATNFNLNWQEVWILADLDGNFEVDDDDIQVINDNFGMTGATRADGDLDGDGVVGIEDLDLAFAKFGLGLNLAS